MEWLPPAVPKSGLESVGLGVEDSRVVLKALAAGASIAEVRSRIATGEILSKRTANGRKHFLLATKRRFLAAKAPLPTIAALSRLMDCGVTPMARRHALLPYVLSSDAMAYSIFSDVVAPRLATYAPVLHSHDIALAVPAVFERLGAIPWGPATVTRWAQGFVSVLREVGMQGKGKEGSRLSALLVRPEAFSFHLWGLYEAGLRGSELVTTNFWTTLMLSEEQVRKALLGVASRSWWRHTTLGAAEEITPLHPTLNDWMDHELGRGTL